MGTISAAQASGMHYFSNTNELLQKNNSYSSEAKYLQQDLTTLGYSTNGVDGYFGNNTYNAVKSFQRDYGLSQDGVAGNQTLSKIDSLINQAKNQNVQNSSSGNSGDSISISGNLSKGMQGSAVSDLQSSLTKLGYNTYGVDGVFGQNTYNAVVAFQKAYGLTQDGIVGNQTKSAISAALSSKSSSSTSSTLQMGSTGDTVKQLQRNLTSLGFNTNGVDGIFGQNTYNEVVAFQKSKGLTQDGIVGSQTQSAINSALSKNTSGGTSSTGGVSQTGTKQAGSGMQVSDALVSFVADYEQYVQYPERGLDDGNLTVGYGHVVMPGENFSKGISKQDAMNLLKTELNGKYADSVRQWSKAHSVQLTQNQFDALVDFAYNAGTNALPGSSVERDILSGNTSPNQITTDFCKWDKVYVASKKQYVDSAGVWRRRMDESSMFNNGDYKRDYPTAPAGYV